MIKPVATILTFIWLFPGCGQTEENNERHSKSPQESKSTQTREPVNAIETQETERERNDGISVGLVLDDHAVVHSDSSKQAAVIDTLTFLEDVYVYGEYTEEQTRNFSFDNGGWAKIESGWMRTSDLAVAHDFYYIITPGDTLYERPDFNTNVVVVGESNYPYKIRTRRNIEGQTWVGLVRFRTKGWLPVDRFEPQLEDVYRSLIQHYFGFGPDFYRRPEKNYQQALKVARKMEQIVTPSKTVYITWHDGVSESNAGALSSYLTSTAYRKLERFQEAIGSLRKIIDLYGDRKLWDDKAGPQAAPEIAGIYAQNLQDIEHALTWYHRIIQKYPGEAISGFERNDWVDLRAAEQIVDILQDQPQQLYEESVQIISESPDSTVKLVGHRGRIKSLGERGRYDQMIDSVFAVLKENPTNKRVFFKSTVDFSVGIASAAFLILEKKLQFERIKSVSRRLQREFGDYPVGAFAALRPAIVADRTDESIAEVKRLYQEAQALSEEFLFWDNVSRERYYPKMAAKRLLELVQAEENKQKSKITEQGAELKLGWEDKYPVLTSLAPGTEVEVLYPATFPVSSPANPRVIKVKLENGTIGWVDAERLELYKDTNKPQHHQKGRRAAPRRRMQKSKP